MKSEWKHTSVTSTIGSLAAGNSYTSQIFSTTVPYSIYIAEIYHRALWTDSSGASKTYNYLILRTNQYSSFGISLADNLLDKLFGFYEEPKICDIYISARTTFTASVIIYGNIILNDVLTYKTYIKYKIVDK